MVTIPSGSFFLSGYLTKQIEAEKISANDLSIALKLGLISAYHLQLSRLEEESNEWFFYAKLLAVTNDKYAIKLATIYQIEEEYEQSEFWYGTAIQLKNTEAVRLLAELYFLQHKYDSIQSLLSPIAYTPFTINMLINVALIEGDSRFIESVVSEIVTLGELELLAALLKFQIIKHEFVQGLSSGHQVKKIIMSNKIVSGSCENTVQLFAINLSHLQSLDKLVAGVKNHKLYSSFCFNTPRYISKDKLSCKIDPDEPIQCDESVWRQFTPMINARYIGLMLEQGGANVNNGIMYFDETDNIEIFEHELAHLLGFVDEYPLSNEHVICRGPQTSMFSHNVVVLSTYMEGTYEQVMNKLIKQIPWAKRISVPIIQRVKNKWKVGSPVLSSMNHDNNIGLYIAHTCSKDTIQSFKSTPIVTQLHYYEEPFPEIYNEFLSQYPNEFTMPSYHYNVAKALFRNNRQIEGMKWLSHALKRETFNSNKYIRVKQGKF